MSDDAEIDLAAAREWLTRYQGFAPESDDVVREIAQSGRRFAQAANEASVYLDFDSDAQLYADTLRRLSRFGAASDEPGA